MKTRLERFNEKMMVDASGCHLWIGAVSDTGYAVFWDGIRLVGAHRWIWVQKNGPIPAGYDIDHVKARGCFHRNCVNPNHLEPVTRLVNVERGSGAETAKKRHAQRTHCKRGHPFNYANTYQRPDGSGRACRTCEGRLQLEM